MRSRVYESTVTRMTDLRDLRSSSAPIEARRRPNAMG